MGTKNNPQNRGKAAVGKQYNGKPVKPVLYIGSQIGHGKYMAAIYDDGKMVMAPDNRPLPWDAI